MGIVFTVTAFVASLWCGRRSLGAGMSVVLAAGYFYGIVRANFQEGNSFFLYDVAVFGLYLSRFTLPNAVPPRYAKELTPWVRALIGWPIVMVALGVLFPQHTLIQLVGLRSAIWYLPFLLLGVSACLEDLTLVARTLAFLNIGALVFALGEYTLGLQRFYPLNATTAIIYRCNDVAEHSAYRIPATFSNAASYGSVMVATIPWLVCRWQMPRLALLERWLFGLALLAAMLGVFLCASRLPAVVLLALGASLAYLLRTRMSYLIAALGFALLVGYIVSGDNRLQRFTTLQDMDYVEKRIQVSVNADIIDLLLEYPLGAGLGSAFGTNIPSFLNHLMDQKPLSAENEYARIGLEQGLVGLALWLGFLAWFVGRRRANPPPDWKLGYKLMFLHTIISFGTAFVGCGLLVGIPQTALFLFQIGMLARDYSLPILGHQSSWKSANRILHSSDTAAVQAS
jgi:hypothetical protein